MNEILEKLSDFDINVRKKAFLEVLEKIKKGEIQKDNEFNGWINLHIHTFHSFNYKNWSPSRIVFEGWQKGLYAIGTVDFDTLEGVEETIWAGNLLNMNVISGFESRVYLKELKDKVINSPKEPGIYYLCGKGFTKKLKENSEEGKFFKKMKEISQNRNKKVIEKLNKYLGEITIDYERDVLPLTPSKNPTERHIIKSLREKSEKILGEKVDEYWEEILKIPEKKIKDLRINKPEDFEEILRGKLIKYGSPGYIEPEKENFPEFDEVVKMTEKAGALPVGTWLDGTNPGEENPEFLIELLKEKGIKGITIIPERNWNIKDKKEKEIKLGKLEEFMNVCKKIEMPVICGTEMNKYGQPFVDNFKAPEISIYLPYFIESYKSLFQELK